jgi:hypothetical protein
VASADNVKNLEPAASSSWFFTNLVVCFVSFVC